jgi:hypothetical protein
MAKEKLTLSELQVQGSLTTLQPEDMNQLKGGYVAVKTRRYTYRTRWTMVDIRTDVADGTVLTNGNHGG